MKLYIATASYDSKVTVDYCTSLIKSLKILESSGIECTIGTKNGDCYIAKARNNLTRDFLKSDCTHLLFIDADVGWDEKKILKVVQSKHDVCLGAYPIKQEEEMFPLHLATNADGTFIIEADYLRVHMGPTGFMCIKREVFDGLNALEYQSEDGGNERDYFKTGVFQGKWWGEDASFCRDVISAGYQIWCYTDINFGHWGLKQWNGNVKGILDANKT